MISQADIASYYDRNQYYRKSLETNSTDFCVTNDQQIIQLRNLFQHVADRDIQNVKKFGSQGFDGIFQAHEPPTGNCVLHVAAYKNDTELLEYFLAEGANVNARNKAVRHD